ncbi:MAG: DUF2608 domain-containing protein [Cytophagales bacterium]|nr:DUF2608 domain-containing protein [Cytophagales bacterium]
MAEAKTYIEEIVEAYQPEEILCLFDIDQTIFAPTHPAAQVPNRIKHEGTFFKLMLNYAGFTPAVYGYWVVMDEQQVFDKNIFNLLNFLNERKIKNFAFTATPNISIEGKDLREVRIQQLLENNINFEKNFPRQEIIFDSLNFFHGYPCFYRGIIFSNGTAVCANKGVVLNEFLKKINYNPKCIIFLDDTFLNQVDVNQALAEKNPDIDFYGICYTGAKYIKSPEVSEEEFEKLWDDYFYRESRMYKKIERKKF